MTTGTEEKPREHADSPTVEYHWMITLQWTDGGARMTTRSGVTGVPPGASRNSLANDIYAHVREMVGAPPGAVVLFFSLEPDALAGGA